MAALLTAIAVIGLAMLVVVAVRRRKLHFGAEDWPMARQLETALGLAFLALGLLGLVAGEASFGAWLLLMATLMLAATLREYRR